MTSDQYVRDRRILYGYEVLGFSSRLQVIYDITNMSICVMLSE